MPRPILGNRDQGSRGGRGVCETPRVSEHEESPKFNPLDFWMNKAAGYGNHDSDNFAKRPNRDTDDLSEDDDDDVMNAWKRKAYDEPERAYVPQSKPQGQVAQKPLIRPASADSDADIPYASPHVSGEVSPDQGQDGQVGGMSDQADLDRIFANVGGYNDDGPRRRGGGGGSERGKKSIWKSIGGGISRFAKGLGGVVKNLSGYNLIRHGLFGANYNRGQVKKNTAKYNQTLQDLTAHNDPSTLAARQAEMGHAAFTQRGNDLHSAMVKYDRRMDKSRIALMNNRMQYSGYHMANNFKRAFSDGNIKPRGGLRNFLGAGFAGPSYSEYLQDDDSADE